MKRLDMPKDALVKHEEYFEKNILPRLKQERKGSGGREKDFWELCVSQWKLLAIGTPDELRKIARDIEDEFGYLLNLKTFKNQIKNVFGYALFSKKKEYELNENGEINYWCAYAFVMKNGTRVCPYCNQNYIFSIYGKEKQCRPAIDHFYPQKTYPYLSMSLYNMIPCCEVCNSRLKGQTDIELSLLTPYEYDINDAFRFRYKRILDNDPKIVIDQQCLDDDATFKKYKKIFAWDLIYEQHNDLAERMYERYMKYSRSYFQSISTLFKGISETEMKELRWERIPDNENISEDSLNKLRKDLIEQFECEDEI